MSDSYLLSEAAHWIARLMSGVATAADRQAFACWRARSADHNAAGIEALQLWGMAGEVLRAGGHSAMGRPARRVGAGSDREPVQGEDWSFLAGRAGQLNIDLGFHV